MEDWVGGKGHFEGKEIETRKKKLGLTGNKKATSRGAELGTRRDEGIRVRYT